MLKFSTEVIIKFCMYIIKGCILYNSMSFQTNQDQKYRGNPISEVYYYPSHVWAEDTVIIMFMCVCVLTSNFG